jgi:anti-anti-sigma regulatory factor
MIRRTKIVAGLCLYDGEQLGREAVDDLGVLHQASWPADTPFHICGTDGRGLTIDGELDFSTLGTLERALTAASGGPGTVAVDVGSLTFVDDRSLQIIDRVAAERQQIVIFHNALPIVKRLIDLSGATNIVLG